MTLRDNARIGGPSAAAETADPPVRPARNTAVDGVITVDSKGTIEAWNPAAERIFGYTSNEAVGQQLTTFVGPPFGRLVETLSEWDGQRSGTADLFEGVRKDGTTFPIELSLSHLRLRDCELFTAVVKDISDVLRDEAAHREAEALLRAVVETAVDGIVVIDQHGIIETMNPAAERIFGHVASEVVGQNVAILMPPPFSDEHESYVQRYLTTGEARIVGIGREVTGLRKDGNTFSMNLAVSDTRIGDRRLFTGIVRDLTDHKRAEEERRALEHHRDRLALLRSALEASDIERRRIAGVVHNGCVQDLTGLSLSLQAKADSLGTSAPAHVVAALREAALETAAEMHKMQVALAGVAASPELDRADLISVLADLVPPLRAAGVEVRMLIPSDLDLSPEVEALLFRASHESLLNSLQHGGAKCVTERISSEGGVVTLVIEDDGRGFTPEQMRKRQAAGYSGLRLLEDLVTYAGGTFSIESTPGAGTVVRVELPSS